MGNYIKTLKRKAGFFPKKLEGWSFRVKKSSVLQKAAIDF